MNVSLQNTDKVSALLTISMVKADYAGNAEKQLKKIRKDAQMPGFRKGMVPMSLVKRMYEKSVIADEVNKLLGEAVNNYIQENKVNMLGEPLPNENQQQIDFDTQEELVFLFDLALAPEVSVTVDGSCKVPYYDIDVTDGMVENQVKMYTQRNGKYDKAEAYDASQNDMMKGLLSELDADGNTKEGGIVVEGAVMMPSYMKNEDEKKLFDGSKPGDVITFNPSKAWDGNAVELASLLKIEREAAGKVTASFSYQIEEITRYVPGELDQTIFDQVFGEGVVTSADEFKSRVKEVLVKQFGVNSDFKFLIDARKALLERAGKLEFSEKLLKRIMKTNNPDKDDQFINENYDKSIEELSWQLVRDELLKANEIKVENQDVADAAKEATRAQFAQYGMLNIPDETLDNYAKEMMKKRESVEKLVAKVADDKLAAALKGQVTLERKTISIDEFNKMFEE